MPRFSRGPASKRRRRLLDLFRALFGRANAPVAGDAAEGAWTAADHQIPADEAAVAFDPWDSHLFARSTSEKPQEQESVEPSIKGDRVDDPDEGVPDDPVGEGDNQSDWASLENAERELVEIEDELRERAIRATTESERDVEDLQSTGLDEFAGFSDDGGEGDTDPSLNENWSAWGEDETLPDETFEVEPIEDQFADAQDLYELVEDIARNPWDLTAEDVATRSARSKAASIATRLNTRDKAEQEAAVAYLTELFTHLRHPSTYRAIAALADEELDLETLKNVSELRRVWAETPEFWSRRSRYGIATFSHGAGLLTWSLAHRVCVVRQDLPAELMIDDAWLWEWYAMAPGSNAYFSFACFVAEKVDARDQEPLHLALVLGQKFEALADTADPFDWYRTVEDPEHAIDAGLGLVNPFDPRPISSLS